MDEATNVIEIVLEKIFFSDNRTLVLSFIAKEQSNQQYVEWAVATSGVSHRPISFFNSYETAVEEFQRKLGQTVMGGATIHKHKRYGKIKGHFDTNVRTDGFRIVKKGASSTQKLR